MKKEDVSYFKQEFISFMVKKYKVSEEVAKCEVEALLEGENYKDYDVDDFDYLADECIDAWSE